MNHRTAFLPILVVACLLLFFPTSASAMLHPTQARFLQRDPIGYPDGMNRYEWERSNVANRLDPQGLYVMIDATWSTYYK